jgi:hypothetical protein
MVAYPRPEEYMPNKKLVRHGTNNGYRAEIAMGEACDRCKAAHRVFQTQYTRDNRAKGLKYKGDTVLDHLDGKVQQKSGNVPIRTAYTVGTAPSRPAYDQPLPTDPDETGPDSAAPGRDGPSLADRIKALAVGTPDNDYVNDDSIPDYITVGGINPDPEPDGQEYEQIPEDSSEFIINAAGMAKIEDSLGTYLSIVGMTMEMVDPYCGPVLAENFDNIVHRWAKVIGKYPKAAELFMDGKGGTIMLWIGAIQATWPVLFAMYEHHFSKNVQTSGGNVFRRASTDNGRFDPTMPPMPDNFQYSAG